MTSRRKTRAAPIVRPARRTVLGALAAGAGLALAADAGLAFARDAQAGGAQAGGAHADGAHADGAPARGSAGSAGGSDAGAPFSFALIGDLPYNALEVRMLERVLSSLEHDIGFAIHIGDIKGSWESCDDALLAARLALLESSAVPLVYVPGDNEWTDCARSRAGRFDPNERLEWLRARHFGRVPAGRTPWPFAPVERQADRIANGPPENLRWRWHGVRFVTLNVPGSNNGLDAEGLSVDDWRRRESFNESWLRETYRLASGASDAAVVVIAHANPRFGTRARAAVDAIDGYAGFRSLLLRESSAFAGNTLFVHGDTHHHRVESITPRLLRVESYGSPFSHLWVRIDVDPGAPQPFRVSTRRLELPGAQP